MRRCEHIWCRGVQADTEVPIEQTLAFFCFQAVLPTLNVGIPGVFGLYLLKSPRNRYVILGRPDPECFPE